MNTRLIALSFAIVLTASILSLLNLQPHGNEVHAAPAPRAAVQVTPASVTTLPTIVVTPTAADRAAALITTP